MMSIRMRSRLVPMLLLLACAEAKAGLIPLYNTGVNNDGSLATPGSPDQHYTLISEPAGAGTTAYVVTPPLNVFYDPDPSSSQFISPDPSTNDDDPVGTYMYQTTFTLLPGQNPSTAIITGQFESDNQGEIYLNGVDTGIGSPHEGYESFTPFTLSSGFVTGLNTLDFVVTNTDGTTSLRVELSGTVNSVPEPASVLLLASGSLLSLGYYRYIRRRADT